MTQTELARRLGINASGVSRVESGQQGIALETLANVARALGVTLDDLTGRLSDDESARVNRASDPRLSIQCDVDSPPGLRALANDDALCAAHVITPDEWRRLRSCALPHNVRKAGYLQLLITFRAIMQTADDTVVTEA